MGNIPNGTTQGKLTLYCDSEAMLTQHFGA